MDPTRPSKLSRRPLLGLAGLRGVALALGGCGGLTTRERGANPPAPGGAEYELEAAPMSLNLGGRQEVSTWGYNGSLPGPEIRLKEGQRLRATVLNRLPEDTTVGSKGRGLVRERFLLRELIADELRLYGDLLGARQLPAPVAQVGLAGEDRNPVCGMLLGPERAPEKYDYGGERYYFCSWSCQTQFGAVPGYLLRAIAGGPGGRS